MSRFCAPSGASTICPLKRPLFSGIDMGLPVRSASVYQQAACSLMCGQSEEFPGVLAAQLGLRAHASPR